MYERMRMSVLPSSDRFHRRRGGCGRRCRGRQRRLGHDRCRGSSGRRRRRRDRFRSRRLGFRRHRGDRRRLGSFNQPLNKWNVSNVTNMRNMFAYCSFNQPLNNWDVSNVNTMERMFWTATYFNQPLNNWNVSKGDGYVWYVYSRRILQRG